MYQIMKGLTTFVVSLFVLTSCLQAQSTTLKGVVQDAESREPLVGVEVRLPLSSAFTDEEGRFELSASVANTTVVLSFLKEGYEVLDKPYDIAGGSNVVNVGVINLKPKENIDQVVGEDLIPTVALSTDDFDTQGAQNISGVLTANRDIFTTTAAFVFGRARFRIRGYDSENTTMLMNGVPMNDLESGRVFWGSWGGLNDVMRNRVNSIGLDAVPFSFGGMGGASSIDTRASRHRRQLRASYSLSNTSYRNRVMLTYSTGLLDGGWAFSVSGSRRWAQEGYIDGTPYDSWGYFVSVDKQIGDNHLLNLTAFGSPTKRGRSSASTQEMYDLAGSNFYNPNWGYQNGEKRNARIADSHQPMAILRHDWNIAENTTLTSTLSYQTGYYGGSAIDWYEARDPRADYYRNLPSYIDNQQASAVEALLRENEALRQIDWDYMYEANRNSFTQIENANGIDGNTVEGKRAQYILEDRHYDNTRFNFNTYLESAISDGIALSAGLSYQQQVNHQYKEVLDLLGADFYVDIDKFAEFDSLTNNAFIQNDLETPNKILREGDIFGYNQEIHNRQIGGWAQLEFSLPKVDFFIGASADSKSFWRKGLVQNGKFPDRSKGESEKANFFDYGAKAGVTYKIDGRNYILVNGAYQKRAPYARNSFISPRTRNDLVEDLEQETIYGIEGGYLLKAPNAKLRAIGYFTEFKNKLYNRSFYLDNAFQDADGDTRGGFVNYIMNGVDTRHMGIELGAEYNITSAWRVNAVAAIGKYIFTSRPTVKKYLDNLAQELDIGDNTVYLKNYNVANGPQTAYSFGVNYNSPDYWFVSVNFNYFDDVWIDIFPERRTLSALTYTDDPQFNQQIVEEDSDLWHDILDQEKADPAFTMDFFGGKSWKIDDFFIRLYVGVSNILDNTDFVTGGYEQFRFDKQEKDVTTFPNRYFYSNGRTYFINLVFQI